MFLHHTNTFIQKLFPNYFTWKIKTDKKIIYLTFDDGPIPVITEFVIKTLAKYQAKATFFCIGDNIEKHPEIFKQIINAGHGIGNHTYNHPNGWKSNNLSYTKNTKKCNNIIKKYLPTEDKILFRPPYGRIKPLQAKIINKTNKIIMWNVLSGDFSQNLSPEIVLQKTIKHTQPGSIVLFHDSIKASKNMYFALPLFLEHFSKMGYTFEKID
ncbi:MAG: polysaccharide deacetylase family protein [Pseudarcicella sp.]|nr:polysaccharide deacetylase family protein [Pseudarcicella sp.]MBP6410680.1 polysaccharide deacetylase family protein [Pseudarcicella sp.]